MDWFKSFISRSNSDQVSNSTIASVSGNMYGEENDPQRTRYSPTTNEAFRRNPTPPPTVAGPNTTATHYPSNPPTQHLYNPQPPLHPGTQVGYPPNYPAPAQPPAQHMLTAATPYPPPAATYPLQPAPPQPYHQIQAPMSGPPMALPVVTRPATTLPIQPQQAASKATKTQPQDSSENGKKLGKKKRRSADGSNRAKRTKRRTHDNMPSLSFSIVSDEAPDRITNPLLGTPRGENMNGAEFFDTTELVYCRPDTYPLSYLARLLGFDVPIPDFENPKEFPSALPTDLKLKEDDVFSKIPKPGLSANYRRVTTMGDWDDQHTLDYMDPVYKSLLTFGLQTNRLKAATSTMHAKFAHVQSQQYATRRKLIKLAQTMLEDLPPDWTFADWTSSVENKEQPRWTIDGEKVFANRPSQAFGVVAYFKGQAVAMLKYKFQWYPLSGDLKESELVMIIEGIGQRTMAKLTCSIKGSKTSIEKSVGTGTKDSEVDSIADQKKLNTQEESTPMTAKAITDDNVNLPSVQTESTEGLNGRSVAAEARDVNQDTNVSIAPTVEKSENPCVTQKEEKSEGLVQSRAQREAKSLRPPSSELKVGEIQNASIELGSAESAPLPSVQVTDSVRLVMIALALEHTRACDVWYCLWDTPKSVVDLNRNCFRMVELPRSNGQKGVPMICDLKKCSSRYALLKQNDTVVPVTSSPSTQRRLLARLPCFEEVKSCFDNRFGETQRSKRTAKVSSRIFSGAVGRVREASVGIRAILTSGDNEHVKLSKLDARGLQGEEVILSHGSTVDTQIEILRCFALKSDEGQAEAVDNEVLKELKKKQDQLLAAEKNLEPKLRSLLSKVVKERIAYETAEAKKARTEEKRILEKNFKMIEQRKERDLAWQEQLEQDMNAVCNICNDGEVTPDNQILFCEACNVAVHQMCYGIEEVPEGDYYCMACRSFNRDKIIQAPVSKMLHKETVQRTIFPPLPIQCELCPIKQGAYIRTDTSKSFPDSTTAKWVHMACAKWQGLNFVANPEVVEDVTALKTYFRRLDYKCCICQGQRGAYNQCRFDGCQNWLHVTCARAIGVCEVIHGENVEGDVTENPWTLMCPEHSNIDPETLTKDPVPLEQLIRAAQEFPIEPMPEPLPHKPFNKLKGKDRKKALADPKYESQVFEEILTKKLIGVRCEVCHSLEDDGSKLARCNPCGTVVCVSCRMSDEDISADQRVFRCLACQYSKKKEKEGTEYEKPQCQLCFQKGGSLLPGFANPVNRLSYWKKKPKEFERSLFSKKLWTHTACAFWLKGLEVDDRNCEVNLSNVVMAHGKGYVNGKVRCALCGFQTGMKAKCANENCRARGERRTPYYFHVSCAREAGFEVSHDDENNHVFCYEHGGNEYNLRARLEDLVETEKRRAGKNLSRSDAPMNFNHGSRLLHHALLVVRMLGWAWRWAELWVEFGSTWEPLLEPGQEEDKMTNEEKKIVDSTPGSRCDDARRCRLAAFGAALRNRNYDTEDGFDNDALDRALRAVLNTKSLVGPLEEFEIEFHAEWLARAYRSKSRLLGLGDDKLHVDKDAFFCVHTDDKSPKYELGDRPLPGKHPLEDGQIFEALVQEPDDFLKPETTHDGKPVNLPVRKIKEPPKPISPKKEGEKKNTDASTKRSFDAVEGVSTENPPKKRGPGRPRKADQETKTLGFGDDTAELIASLTPSALKKRTDQLPRGRSLELSSERIHRGSGIKRDLRSPRKEQGFPILEASVLSEAIMNPTSILTRGRRGRRPRVLELAVVVIIGDVDFSPFQSQGARVQGTKLSKAFDDEAGQISSASNEEDEKRKVMERMAKTGQKEPRKKNVLNGNVNGAVEDTQRNDSKIQLERIDSAKRKATGENSRTPIGDKQDTNSGSGREEISTQHPSKVSPVRAKKDVATVHAQVSSPRRGPGRPPKVRRALTGISAHSGQTSAQRQSSRRSRAREISMREIESNSDSEEGLEAIYERPADKRRSSSRPSSARMKSLNEDDIESGDEEKEILPQKEVAPSPGPARRGPGRPRKNPAKATEAMQNDDLSQEEKKDFPPKSAARPRGRPRGRRKGTTRNV